jgi:DNA polymerase-4
MDAFYASIEQRDHPEMRGRPVIVGGAVERRGVVATCSYEARSFGIHSAMPMGRAKSLCPNGIFLEGDMRKYREVSEQIRAIFHEYAVLVEPLSIDEAYLDVTENRKNCASASRLARMIQVDIFQKTGLTASAGVSYNKFLAKVASGLKKPAGLSVVTPEEAEGFLDILPIEKFHGIGRVTAQKLRGMNVKTGRELKRLDPETLTAHFGKTGLYFYHIVRGVDDRPVTPDEDHKSLGRENTFPVDLADLRRIRINIRTLARKVSDELTRYNLAGRTVTLKVRYGDFQTVTRSVSVAVPVAAGEEIGDIAVELLRKTEAGQRPVRLLGVTVSNFPAKNEPPAIQLEFDF